MLFLSAFFVFGSSFCYGQPCSLVPYLTKPPYNLDPHNINMFYTVYSLPNIVVPLFGGIMLDKIGVRKSLMIFSTVLTLGQCLFVIGGML
jgi:MFS family permease